VKPATDPPREAAIARRRDVEDAGTAVVAEFIGTFALVFIGGGATILGANGQLDPVGVALAQGFVLFLMITVLGPISGGVFNPALAIAMWVTDRLPAARTGVFILTQVVAAVAAASLLKYVIPAGTYAAGSGGTPLVMPCYALGKAIMLEAVATLFLMLAVFGTALDDRGPSSKMAGSAVGLTIAFDVLAFGPFTGAAMNPARWFGPALVAGTFDNWYVWVVGPVAGAIIAAVLYLVVFLRGSEPATP